MLRSGAGAHFHSHSIVTGVAWEQVMNYLSEEAQLLLVNSSSPDDRLTADTRKRQHYKHATVAGGLSQLSSVKFGMIDCSPNDIVLMVGSGLTADAQHFAASLHGKLISFPTVEGKDVVNAAMSGSVALFEIARQLRLQATHTLDAANEGLSV